MGNPNSRSGKLGKSMSFMTFIAMVGLIFSKCSSYLREMFVARSFSENYSDAFYNAFTIPDLVFNLLVMGAIQSAITPMLASSISKGEEKKGLHIVSTFLTVASILMLCVSAICFIFSKQIMTIFIDPAEKPLVLDLASQASRILYPQIFFMMLAALEIGVLNAYKRFGSTSFGPTIYSIGVVISVALFADDKPERLNLCMVGIMVAAIIYFLFQFIVGRDKLRMIRPNLDIGNPEFKALIRRAIPILFSSSIVQINLMVMRRFANKLDTGTVTCFQNAQTLWQLPYGIFAGAVGNVMLPSLSALYAAKKFKESSELLSSRIKTALFMTIPSAGFLLINSYDIIRVLFKNGKYTETSVKRAGLILMGFCAAIVLQTVVLLFNQAFYALGKTRVPLFSGIISLVFNPIFCMIFMKILEDPDNKLRVSMSLSLAYSLSSLIQMLFLIWLYNSNKKLAPRNLLPFIIKSGICLVMMIIVMIILNKVLPDASGYGKLYQIMFIGVKAVAAFIIYFMAACLIRMNEALYWIRKVTSRLGVKI